jgi:hypothetical protein
MTVVTLVIAILALVLSSAGVVAALAWRKSRRLYVALAERIDVDARLEYLTTQTLAAMRDVVRNEYRRNEPF